MDWPSITRRCFLFLTGGMFAKLGLGHAAIEADAQALSAGEILQRMAATYANCKTYQDSGCLTTVFIRSDGQRTDKRPFLTAFVRPARFRFEFKSSFDGRTWHRYLVWGNGSDTRTWWDIKPGVQQQPSLAMALAGATGVSGGSAHTVPALLMPENIGGNRPTDPAQLKRLEDAKFDEVECFRVQRTLVIEVDPAERERRRQEIMKLTGKDWSSPASGPETLWIDRSTFRLRRIDETTQFDDFRTESMTTYEPLLDVAIADGQLRFDPLDK